MPDLTQEPRPASSALRPAAGPESSAVGDLRLHELHSRIYGNTRMLRVWLPPGYEERENVQRYPVLYLNDGQNLFDRATAFAGIEWQVDETADRLIREKAVAPLIIVGIDNAQKDRMREYLPYPSFNPPAFRPQGKRYLDFLLREVMPFIEQRYRTAGRREHTGLGGSSLGALISLYTVMAAPDIFGRLLLESPSLFVCSRKVLRDARRFRDWPARIFLAVGTRETGQEAKDRKAVDDVRDLAQIFSRSGLSEERLRLRIDQDATHSEAAWAARFPEALTFLFGTPKKLVE